MSNLRADVIHHRHRGEVVQELLLLLLDLRLPRSERPLPTFESKFARMEPLGDGKFALYFKRHTGDGLGYMTPSRWTSA